MTTIAYKDGVMVGDTRVTDGTGKIVAYTRKVFRTKHWLVGFCGSAVGIPLLSRLCSAYLDQDAEPIDDPHIVDMSDIGGQQEQPGDETEEVGALMVHLPTGRIWIAELTTNGQLIALEVFDPYMAIGSGSSYATGAMDMGASAFLAVELASKRDSRTGGECLAVSKESEQTHAPKRAKRR